MDKAQQIKAKLYNIDNGLFIRHMDGNTLNNTVDNLKWVHFKEALENPDWVVDWTMYLTKSQVDFVNLNRANFLKIL